MRRYVQSSLCKLHNESVISFGFSVNTFSEFIGFLPQEKALEQLKVTESKTVAVGQKMDLVFYTLQLGFFYMDFDLISKSIDKAKK